jgi:hypothetical protein
MLGLMLYQINKKVGLEPKPDPPLPKSTVAECVTKTYEQIFIIFFTVGTHLK